GAGMSRPKRVYRYVVANDDGIAPNPEGNVCTLAICKPGIRRNAQPGDLILGFASKRHGTARLIFAMVVGRSVRFGQYWRDARLRRRRDNIYRSAANGELVQVRRGVHEHEDDQRRDWRGQNVLISSAESWWYFGRSAPHFGEIV